VYRASRASFEQEMLTVALGFNGGSALAANLRAAQACIVTNLAASVGGMTWMFWVRTFAQHPNPPI
jgi:ammonia channel protein AmtB